MEQVNVCAPYSCYVKLIDVMPDSDEPNACDKAIVQSARVSYDEGTKGDERDRKLIHYLMEHDHTSPFEMVELKFEVACPLPIATQWIRHRTGSYNQVSRRYTDVDMKFYVPDGYRLQSAGNKQASDNVLHENSKRFELYTKRLYAEALQMYTDMVQAGIAREQARFILPQGLMTKFIFKMDLHNLFHFIRLRMSPHAQWEIQQLATAIYMEYLLDLAPWACEAFEQRHYNELKISRFFDTGLQLAKYELVGYDERR